MTFGSVNFAASVLLSMSKSSNKETVSWESYCESYPTLIVSLSPHEQQVVPWRPPTKCRHGCCPLCIRGIPRMLRVHNTWLNMLIVAMECLTDMYPDQPFITLTMMYEFCLEHWTTLGIGAKNPGVRWKKLLQDVLCHNKHAFVSGTPVKGRCGFWALRWRTDPWEADPTTTRTLVLLRKREYEQIESGSSKKRVKGAIF